MTRPPLLHNGTLSRAEGRELLSRPAKRKNKYGAVKTVCDGITFASSAEAKRYGELRLLEKRGFIRNLAVQPEFPFEIDGKRIFVYRADFIYFEGDGRVVEETKGFQTPVWRLKQKLIEAQYGFKITVTK